MLLCLFVQREQSVQAAKAAAMMVVLIAAISIASRVYIIFHSAAKTSWLDSDSEYSRSTNLTVSMRSTMRSMIGSGAGGMGAMAMHSRHISSGVR